MLILLLFQKMTVKNDIYANQTKCIGKFGDVFYNGLYILGPKTFKNCFSCYVTFMVDIVK